MASGARLGPPQRRDPPPLYSPTRRGSYWGTHATLWRSDALAAAVRHLESNPLRDADMHVASNAEERRLLVWNGGLCRQDRRLPSDNCLLREPAPPREKMENKEKEGEAIKKMEEPLCSQSLPWVVGAERLGERSRRRRVLDSQVK